MKKPGKGSTYSGSVGGHSKHGQSEYSGPVHKTGGGFGHSSIPRKGYFPSSTDHRGDIGRDSYGGARTKRSGK